MKITLIYRYLWINKIKFRSVAEELTMYASKKVLYSFLENRAIDQLKKYDGLRCYLFEWKMDSKPLFVAIVKSLNGCIKPSATFQIFAEFMQSSKCVMQYSHNLYSQYDQMV